MNERLYYACSATIASKQHYFLWYSDDVDGVLLAGINIRTFPTANKLANYCSEHKLPLSDDSTANYDLDSISQWIANPEGSRLDNDCLLNFWNLMDDYCHSFEGERAIADVDLDLHEKLSLSSFSVSSPGLIVSENYKPEWTASERTRLAGLLHALLLRFQTEL